MTRAVHAFIAFVLLPGCTSTSASDPVDQAAVAEAVYRYQIGNNASGQPGGVGLYCLERRGLGGEAADAPADTVTRLSTATARVVPASRCRIGGDTTGNEVEEIATGGRGILLSVRSIACSTPTRCTVEGGYYQANMSASGNTYTVERRGGSWVVTGDQLNVIS